MKKTVLLLTASLWLALVLPAGAAISHALIFDGVDDYVDMFDTVVPTSGDFTVSCWVCAKTPTNSMAMEVLSQGSSGNAFYIGMANGRIRAGDGWQDTGCVFPMDAWHHLAVVKTDTNTLLYVDGRLSTSRGGPIPNPAASPWFRLGRQYGGYGEFLRGLIADVRVWKRSLSEDEIRATWDQPATATDPGLVGGWQFDEMIGQTSISVCPPAKLWPMKTLVYNGELKPSIANVGMPAITGWLMNGTERRVLPTSPARLHASAAVYHRPGDSYSLLLNGWDNWVNTGVAAIPAGGDFTVECWANCSRTPEDLGRGEMLSQGSAGNAFYIGVGGGKVRLGDGWEATGLAFPMGSWHHFAVVKTSGETRFYLDGTNVLNRGWAIPNPSGETQLRLGRQYGSHGENWPGMIDEVRVWSRALSTAEIQTGMYYAPDEGSAYLEAYWPLDLMNVDASGRGHPLNLDGWPESGWVSGMGGGYPTMAWQQGGTLFHECHQPYANPIPFGAKAVAGGYTRNLVLSVDGRVTHWGQTGPEALCSTPNLDNVVAISASQWNWMALRANGKVVSWGLGRWNQPYVPAHVGDVVAIATSLGDCLALQRDGVVKAWGADPYGFGKLRVPPQAVNVVAIGGKWHHWLAARSDGRVVAWGKNASGQCNVPASATNVVAVEGGEGHSLALRSDGTVLVWGANCCGECNVPPTATNIVAISTYYHHNLALRSDGTLIGWGLNNWGQCNMPAWATNVVGIAAGLVHTVAVRADGSFSAWGNSRDMRTVVPYGGYAHPPIDADQTVDGDTPGTYKVTYSITNEVGRVPMRTLTVIVRDTTAPQVVLTGSNVVYHVAGSPWIDPGVTASDACSGDLTGSVAVSGALNVEVPGLYTLRYAATDPSGNTGFTNRAVQVGMLSEIAGWAGAYDASETFFGTCTAKLRATLNPNGLPTTVFFEYWPLAGPTNTFSVELPARFTATNLMVQAEWLAPGAEYHWRVTATNLAGISTSPEQVLTIPAVASMSGLSGICYANDPLTGTVLARLMATVNPNSQPTTVTFQQGRTTNYVVSTAFDLPATATATNLVVEWANLIPNNQYHWRVVASNAFGVVATPDYPLVARVINPGGVIGGGSGTTSPIGDFDGSGTVDRSEVESVLFSYLSSGVTLAMTNLSGLGQSLISLTVPEVPYPTLQVLVSTNMTALQDLGPAVPRYEFMDTNAPAAPQRYYQLRWP